MPVVAVASVTTWGDKGDVGGIIIDTPIHVVRDLPTLIGPYFQERLQLLLSTHPCMGEVLGN